MLRRLFSRNLPQLSAFAQTSRRGIATYETPELKTHVEHLEQDNPHLHEDMQMLRNSPRTFHFEQGSEGGKYNADTQRVTVGSERVDVQGRRDESTKHEAHHAAQHESNLAQFHPDTVTSVHSNDAHRLAMELPALASGHGSTPTQEARLRVMEEWKRYAGEPGYKASLLDAKELLRKSKFHQHSRNRLSDMGFDVDHM